jgi:dTDP-4-amino-4,6-dideoxygalactose transaminase
MALSIPRKLALLGGTTTLGDCLTAAGLLLQGRLRSGAAISQFETELASFIGVHHACTFSAGRVGLYALMKALDVGPGDEVLLQVPTHVVVPNAIRYAGARPVFVDCSLANYNIDFEDAARKVTSRTRALVLQHTFGIPADMDCALALASRFNLILIEDCVHSLGAQYRGRRVGSFGRAAFFSTEETKTISSTMGGVVVTDDDQLAARLRDFQHSCPWQPRPLVARYLLKFILYWLLTEPHLHVLTRTAYESFGRRQPLPQPTSAEEAIGDRPSIYEQRFSHAQAVLVLRQLRRIDSNLAHRRAVTAAYAQRLNPAGFPSPSVPTHTNCAMLRYPVWVDDRQAVVHGARRHAVLGTWFTSVLEESEALEAQGYIPGTCPRAEAATQHLVNLPIHSRVTARDAAALTAAIVSSCRNPQTKPQQFEAQSQV